METRSPNAATILYNMPTRTDIVQKRDAIKTELAPPVAISAQVGSEQVDLKKENLSKENKNYQTSVDIDKETGDLVYKVLDPSTKEVVLQYPYETLLKLRAYRQEKEKAADRKENLSFSEFEMISLLKK